MKWSPEGLPFGAVWCAEHQGKMDSPDEREPSGEIFLSVPDGPPLEHRLGLGLADDIVQAIGAVVGVAVFARPVFDNFCFEQVRAVFAADAGQFAFGGIAIGNADATAVVFDDDNARQWQQGLAPARLVELG